MKMMNKVCALMLSAALCAGMAVPAFAYGGDVPEEVEQPILTAASDEEDSITVTDEETGALTPEGNLSIVDPDPAHSGAGASWCHRRGAADSFAICRLGWFGRCL